MEVVFRRCCGLDIHQKVIWACVLAPDGETGRPTKKMFGTFRKDLGRLRGWLKQMRVTHLAMESTAQLWRAVWEVLEDPELSMLVAQPAQVKALQGRKSDKRDCQRIAEFLHDGRLDASFIPPPEIRQLRTLTRHRVALLEQRTQVHNQIRDLLETACIKLSSVASDLMGVTGVRILRALADGETSPERLSWKARGKLRAKESQIKEAMKGDFSPFHRCVLQLHMEHYDFLSGHIAKLEEEIAERMKPYAEQIVLLGTIPGVDRIVAWNLLAEMGADMSVFPDSAHCASWAGLAPGSNESAGKTKSTRTKKGNRYLRRILTQAAWANSRRKDGYLRTMFFRIKARRTWGRAIVAVAHKIVVISYHILKDRTPYQELGGDYFDKLEPERTVRRLAAKLEKFGYSIVKNPEQPEVIPSNVPEPAPAEPAKRKRGRPRKYPPTGSVNPGVSTV